MTAPGVLVQPEPIPARHELKYVIPDSLAVAIRDAIRPYCAPDPHSAGGRGSVIRSLYLDTWSHELYRASRERHPSRLKLRVRTYGDEADLGPVFLEIKRKHHGLVLKSRARVPATAWTERVRGPVAPDASEAERLFRDEVARRALVPTLLVRYEREAWVGTIDRYARATFDRRIACAPCPRWTLAVGAQAWMAVDDRMALKGQPQATVLELKCERDVPRWLSGLVERFGLQRVGVSKYCRGVERAWEPEWRRRDLASPWEG